MNTKMRNAWFAPLGQISTILVILSLLFSAAGVHPVKAAANWVAYNDSASPYPSPQGNITTFSFTGGGGTSGSLKKYADGTNTAVTVTFTKSSGTGLQATTNGEEATSGTDAYTTFNGKVNSAGVIACVGTTTAACSSSDYIDVTFTGLNPSMTYTFATTTVRNGGSSYTDRNARYTISDITSATNASTSGVTVLSNESVWFNAGNNKTEGYVARWNNIVPGSDGDFTVRAQPQGSNNQFYGQTVFMLEEDGPITGPNIFVSSSMTGFSSQPGTPSAEKSYTVSGVNLTAPIVITPPADFQISKTSGSGYSSSAISLSPTSGSVASTTIYVRFNRATAGTSSGNITHTSTGATTVNVPVSGTAAVAGAWVAYNDSAAAYPSDASKITEISISGTTSGLLKNYDTGENTNVTATFTTQGNLTNSTGNGAEPAAGTDAYDIFSGKVNMAGVVACTDQTSPACADNTWYMDLTFTGLDPAQTYSFATTTVRDGDSANYGTRNALFTISDIDSAVNASSAGVTVVSNESVWFNAGMNQVEGYVARWDNIHPGSDGDFTVRAQPQGTDFRGYGQSVFMLAQETSGPPVPTIAATSSMTSFNAVPGVPSAQKSYTVSGSNLTDNIVITPPADFEISTTSGSNFSTNPIALTQSGGSVPTTTIFVRFNRATVGTSNGNITHTSTGATTQNVAVSGMASNENMAPNTPLLVQPADNAADVIRPPTLKVNVSDPNPADSLNVTFYGRALGGGSAGADFDLVVFPDTQHEADTTGYNAAFTSQAQWISDNKTSQNIAFVTHVGDIVNTATNASEWQVADNAFKIIDTAGVRYSVGPGNHDTGGLYETYFGVARFQGKTWYQGHYGSDNMNNYSFFTAGGMDFILINLQDYPTQAQLDWANSLMQQYSSRRAIVETHTILEIDNSVYNAAPINALKGNANLFLMLCGHRYSTTDGAAYLAQAATDGHTIHIVMQDYQQYNNAGGDGYLRLYKFSPANNVIHMTTYSPYNNVGSITTSPDQMDLAYSMASSGPFQQLGTVNGVANGADASYSWTGLTAGTKYEWYAVVSDGSLSTTGPTWSFTASATSNQPPVISGSDSQTVNMSEDSPNTFSLSLSASDPDAGNTLTWSIAQQAGHGTASASGTGASPTTLSYIPAQDYSGPDSFVVQVADNYGATDSVTINVNIAPVNDAPVITEGASVGVSMSEDGSPSAFSLTLHATDVDTAASALTWSISGAASHGTADASGMGASKAISYTPAANYNGPDSFIVQVSDGNLTDTITVNLTVLAVNDLPVANAQSVTTPEDTAKAVTLTGTDLDNDPLVYAILTTPAHGTLSGTAPNLTYTPAANYYGADSFTFRVNDGHVNSASAIISITVTAVNDAPVANAQAVTAAKETPKDITLTATDVDNASLSYSIVTNPGHGALSGSAPHVTYTPEANYTGPDYFTFKANDGALDSNIATVTIEVTEANVPVLPANFYGEIHFSDTAPNVGDMVEAYIDGVGASGKAATVDIKNTSGTLTYAFNIPGDQPATTEKEGGVEGDPITFKINGRVVATAIWHGGTSNVLNFHPPMAIAGGPYSGVEGSAVNFNGSVSDTVTDSATYQWDWDNDGTYDSTGQSPSHTWVTGGSFTVGLKVTDAQGGVGTATAQVVVMATQSIALVQGWNLVSFGLHPTSTAALDVLASIQGNYDMVYAYDASGAHSNNGNWMRYAPNVPGNSLSTLDETQGFWIHMTTADTLDIVGTVPTTTNISLSIGAGGWNLVGYPSDANHAVPDAFTSHGVPTSDFTMVYAYRADDATVPPDPWKRYAVGVPGNDLPELLPGLGYWIFVSTNDTWQVLH
jgi:hypothetical protein